MKKIVLSISLMFIALFLGSTISLSGENLLREGTKSPQLIVENKDSVLNLKELCGKYVLVDFWSSADAQSRLKSKEYASFDDADGILERVSVNFDRSERLFEEIVSRDGLDPSNQYYADAKEAKRIKRDFGLDKGYKSFLIDPKGRIIAVNPDRESVRRLLAHSL